MSFHGGVDPDRVELTTVMNVDSDRRSRREDGCLTSIRFFIMGWRFREVMTREVGDFSGGASH